jgi:hypothetical protein
MNPTSKDGVFANEEYLLVFGVKGAAYDGVVIRFNVFAIFILQETLIEDLFRNFPLVYHHITASIVHPQTVSSKGLLVVQSDQDSITDEFHVINRCFLLETIHQFKSLVLLNFSICEFIQKDALRPTDAQYIRR